MTMNLLTRESEIARLEAELATLRAQLAEAREANDRLTQRLRWIRVNPNDAVAMRFALVATDEEFDNMKHLVNTA